MQDVHSKRARGRPRGSSACSASDNAHLAKMADLIVAVPKLRPAEAMRKVVGEKLDDSHRHRLHRKWREQKNALIVAAQLRLQSKQKEFSERGQNIAGFANSPADLLSPSSISLANTFEPLLASARAASSLSGTRFESFAILDRIRDSAFQISRMFEAADPLNPLSPVARYALQNAQRIEDQLRISRATEEARRRMDEMRRIEDQLRISRAAEETRRRMDEIERVYRYSRLSRWD